MLVAYFMFLSPFPFLYVRFVGGYGHIFSHGLFFPMFLY